MFGPDTRTCPAHKPCCSGNHGVIDADMCGARNKHSGRTLSGHVAGDSLDDRLGGAFAMAAIVDHFSDNVLRNPMVGAASQVPVLLEWRSTQAESRLPGLMFLRTPWVCAVAGSPFKREGASTPLGDHKGLRITSAEFDEVAAELGRALAHFKVPKKEADEVLDAFAKHRPGVALVMPKAR